MGRTLEGMGYLFLSFLLVNLLHGYLLYDHRQSHPATISYHASKNNRTLIIYAVGHLIAGVLLALVVSDNFLTDSYKVAIIATAATAVITEWLQAIFPAKGKTDVLHTVFAVIMAFSMVLLGFLCTIVFSSNQFVQAINLTITAILVSFLVVVRYPPRNYFWKVQFIGQLLLYLQMFLILSTI